MSVDLDNITLQNDARQGEATIRMVYHFLGRFVAYPSETCPCRTCVVVCPHSFDGSLGIHAAACVPVS